MGAQAVDVGDGDIAGMSLFDVRRLLEVLAGERLLNGLPARMEATYQALCRRETELMRGR